MCEKIKQRRFKLRTALRSMERGEQIRLEYSPKQMSLSTIRVTASAVGIDFGSKYKVSKQGKEILIERIK